MQIGMIQGVMDSHIEQAQIRVFAVDHGLNKHGISVYPSHVTAQMVVNFLTGGAAINVLARQHNIELKVVDTGVATDFASYLVDLAQLLDYEVRLGSRDALNEPAMTNANALRRG